jgi:hypothetical protein
MPTESTRQVRDMPPKGSRSPPVVPTRYWGSSHHCRKEATRRRQCLQAVVATSTVAGAGAIAVDAATVVSLATSIVTANVTVVATTTQPIRHRNPDLSRHRGTAHPGGSEIQESRCRW